MFQLKKEEVPKEFSKSQIVTLNEKGDKRGTNIKKMPYAFTEQGIYMLATVLKGKLAEQQNLMQTAMTDCLFWIMVCLQNRHIIVVHPVRTQERSYVP